MFHGLIRPLEKTSTFLIYVPCRTAKTELPIKWERPPRTYIYQPVKSGDLTPVKPVDMKRLPPLYEKSKELQT